MSRFSKWLDRKLPASIVRALAGIAARLLRRAAERIETPAREGAATGIGAALDRAHFEDRALASAGGVAVHGEPPEGPAVTSGGALEPEPGSEPAEGAPRPGEPSSAELTDEPHSGPRAIGGYVGRGITPASRRDR